MNLLVYLLVDRRPPRCECLILQSNWIPIRVQPSPPRFKCGSCLSHTLAPADFDVGPAVSTTQSVALLATARSPRGCGVGAVTTTDIVGVRSRRLTLNANRF